MTLSDLKPIRLGEMGRSIVVAVVVGVVGSLVSTLSTVYSMGVWHAQTESTIAQVKSDVVDLKIDVKGVRDEQSRVRSDLTTAQITEHDAASALRAMAEDLASGRAQTRARLTVVEEAQHRTGESIAAMLQAQTDMQGTLTAIERDLAAVRDSVGVGRVTTGRGH